MQSPLVQYIFLSIKNSSSTKKVLIFEMTKITHSSRMHLEKKNLRNPLTYYRESLHSQSTLHIGDFYRKKRKKWRLIYKFFSPIFFSKMPKRWAGKVYKKS